MDQQSPDVPAYQPSAEPNTAIQPAGKNKRKILALWLLIGPTALIIGSLIFYAVVNFLFGSLMYETSAIRTVLNVILFIVGAISVMTWLPGIIAGIILLTTQKKS